MEKIVLENDKTTDCPQKGTPGWFLNNIKSSKFPNSKNLTHPLRKTFYP